MLHALSYQLSKIPIIEERQTTKTHTTLVDNRQRVVQIQNITSNVLILDIKAQQVIVNAILLSLLASLVISYKNLGDIFVVLVAV